MPSRTMTRGGRGAQRFTPFTTPRVLAVAATLIGCAACGGAAETDLFTAEPSTLDGSTAPTGGDAGGGSTTGGTGTPDATVPRTDAGAPTPDAGVVDAAPPRDTGPPHTPTTIACGSERCSLPAQDCCRTVSFANDVNYACVNKGACFGFQSLTIPCDDSADCATLGSPGQLCCYTATSNGVTDVRCRAAAECLKPSRGNLCDPAQPITTACPNASGANVTCAPSTFASFDFPVCVP